MTKNKVQNFLYIDALNYKIEKYTQYSGSPTSQKINFRTSDVLNIDGVSFGTSDVQKLKFGTEL